MASQSYYPMSPHKELDKFTYTQTHTHTDHIPSNYDHITDEATTQGVQLNQRFSNELSPFNQKSLSKVRSMPQTQFGQYRYQPGRGSVGDETQMFGKTDFNNAGHNVEYDNLSPVPNRIKPNQLNQTMNTNVESRQFVGQTTTPNKSPKLIQKSTSGFLPQHQGYELQTQQVRPMTTVVSQDNQVPIANQRVSFLTNPVIPQYIRGEIIAPRASSMSIVNRPSVTTVGRPSFNNGLQSNIAQLESRNAGYESREVHKSNMTAAETRRQYESILIDQKGNQVVNALFGQPSRQQKFSFTADTIEPSPRLGTVQQYQQVEIQRPNYRKIYNQKGEYYRTVGPQQDYYKEEVTCCSKLLPVLGVIALILLVAGTLVGVGALTGLIGGKNYLSRAEGQSISGGMISNEIEDGKVVKPTTNTGEVVAPPIVPIVAPVVPPVTKNQTVVQPVVPGPSTTITKPVEPTTEPVKPIQPVTPVINEPMTQPTTEPVIEPVKPILQPVVQPVTQPVTQPNVLPVIQPTQQPAIQPVVQPDLQPVVPAVEPKPVTKPEQKYILETQTKITKPLPTIQPVVIPVQIQPVQPVEPGIIEPVKIQPVAKPVETIQPTIVTIPITQPTTTPTTKPIQPTNIQPITTIPTTTVQPITTKPITQPVTQLTTFPAIPISPQEADKVVTTIIQQNNQLIPINFKTSIKQDILNEFENVPINFRDVHQLQELTYKHIERVKKAV